MISQKDKRTICAAARRYKAKKVILFGSATRSGGKGHDIDLAVEGIKPKDFVMFYADVLFGVKKYIDLVDLTPQSKFNHFVRQEGVVIFYDV